MIIVKVNVKINPDTNYTRLYNKKNIRKEKNIWSCCCNGWQEVTYSCTAPME